MFISYNPEACKGASAEKMVAFMGHVAGCRRAAGGRGESGMFNYCYEVLGGKKNLPKDFDYW